MLSPSSNKNSGAFSAIVTGFTPVSSVDYHMNREFDNLNVLCSGSGEVDHGDVVPLIGDSDSDKEVDDIACRLRKLQERRSRMVQQWRANDVGVVQGLSTGDHVECHGHLLSTKDGEQLSSEQNTPAEPSSRKMDESLLRLRQELASLLSGDDAIFDQLLTIRRSISQLKHQQFEDLYEDAELQLLTSSGTLSLRRNDSMLKSGSRVYSRFTPPENNCEDSGISLESSGISSPSMSPSPVTAAVVVSTATSSTTGGDDPTLRRNSVTFPPSRTRQNRHSSRGVPVPYGLSEAKKSSCRSIESRENVLGEGWTSRDDQKSVMTTKGCRRSLCGPSSTPPPALLVRSRSVTFLPRGVLVRRDDSGTASTPADGEVFV